MNVDAPSWTETDNGAAALHYAYHGFRVHPVHSPVFGRNGALIGCTCEKGAACESTGKHPRLKGWQEKATTDPDQIAAWWRRWPTANVGIATGDGIAVLDIDPRYGGDASIMELEDEHGELVTLTATTGGGGWHLYLAGTLPSKPVPGVEGIDMKSTGGLVAAPPSLHPSGRRYTWLNPGEGLRVVPRWLRNMVDPPKPNREWTGPKFSGSTDSTAYVQAAIEAEVEAVATAREGTRNDSLNAAAFALARFIRDGHATARDVRGELERAAAACGLGEHEAGGTIDSAFRARGVR